MNVLVAGGAGYVGCVLVRELLCRRHAVRVFDRLLFGDDGLAGVRSRIELEAGDIREVSCRQLEGLDAVINLGGISSDPTAEFKPELTHDINVAGAVRLARMCKDAGVGRYLFASSCSVYDADAANDESDVLLDESAEVHPVSAYAKSKLEAERQLAPLADEDFCPVFLRKATVYGFSPRMRFDLVINTLLKDALSHRCMTLHAGGETWRPVVEVRDVVRAYAACLDAEASAVRGQAVNVVYANLRVCEMALRVRETLRAMGITTDVRAEYTQAKSRSYRVSGRRLAQAVGFRPTVSIEESVRGAVDGFHRHGMDDFENPKYYNTRWLEDLE